MILSLLSVNGQLPGPSAGSFQAFSDIGLPGIEGKVNYQLPDQEYILEGSGENIWFGKDSFSFLWRRMNGDFILQAKIEFTGEGAHPHRKAGLMIRSGLSPDAPHVSCVIHGDGLTSLQYRAKKGEEMQEIRLALTGADVLQIEKKGDSFTMSAARFGEVYQMDRCILPLDGELMAGLFICSHDNSVTETARFSNVRIFGTAPDDLVPYQEYIGSMLETMDRESGRREFLAGTTGCWEAPNWTHDGKSLVFNAGGLLYRFDLETLSSEILPTGFANRNNNDHVISFDGTQLAISHHSSEDNGQSVVYTIPAGGGIPERVTPLSPSYLHGWSPDNRYLVYTGGRNGIYNIYRIPFGGGKEVQLTNEPTLDDGPEYSPDGKYIYFNSCRTGTMQIWRMDQDGGNQTQLTYDSLNNWFPHVSPDNKWIVFLSYPPEVPADAHPFYQRVYLRLMSVADLQPRVIGYLYGGQGTMNVPSWSPDSKKFAFMSNGIF